MAEDPQGATDSLKLILQNVLRSPELSANQRAELRDQIETALREADRQLVIREKIEIQLQEQEAVRREQERVLEDIESKERRLTQLMARFSSLMAEEMYREAEEVSDLARELDPTNAGIAAAGYNATMMDQITLTQQLRLARNRGVLATLATVEKAHIPTPDEPPILYPPAEVWQALTERRKEYAAVSLERRNPAEKKILAALEENTVLEFIETPLADVVAYLKDLHQIPIVIDRRALDDAGIGSDTPITQESLRGISLKSALRIMLRDFDLTYIIDDEVLQITTKEEAESRLVTKVYPVADLVLPIENIQGMGMGGLGMMGGGMGGGMGGMGMGGGMGGMGMGGGMGGMGGGGGFFAVPSDLKLTAEGAAKTETKEAAPQQPAKPAASAKKLSTITPEMKPGVSITEAWDNHFATQEVDPANVRETVRELMGQKQYPAIVALIQAALKNHHAQPWMYEALALAMLAGGSEPADIERALLSAADFFDNTAEMMYLAKYMSGVSYFDDVTRRRLQKRALKLYRQVSMLEPSRHEPYMLGLELAIRLNDVDGKRWATCGIASRAWPKDKGALWKQAADVAWSTIRDLRASKRNDAADLFESELKQALQRDCVIRVSWTGDADVDLLVEEPSGTICSLRNPYTTAGGIMLGDSQAIVENAIPGAHSEVYCCPQGFKGQYRLLVRRVWGKPTANKVVVDVYKNVLSDKVTHNQQTVPVGDADAVVVFDLEQGRRQQPLAEQQVAMAAQKQAEVGRQVLAQQLGAVADEGSLRDFRASRQFMRQGGQRGFPPFNRGAVGFQPVITVLPEGANLSTNAVISADRRYVRITALPFFSGIAEVNVFNMQTGAGGMNNQGMGGGQGTGGQGFGGMGGGGGGGFGGGGGGGFGGGGGGGGFGGGGGGGGFGGGGGGAF